MKNSALALALMALLAAPAFAEYEAGQTAYHCGDFYTAIHELRPAAEQGNTTAQFYLGNMYRHGQGVERDDVEAGKWYEKAANAGNAQAQYNLGLMYALGKGVAKDNIQAYKWLLLAGAKGHDTAAEKRDLIGKRLTADEIAEAESLARAWYTSWATQK